MDFIGHPRWRTCELTNSSSEGETKELHSSNSCLLGLLVFEGSDGIKERDFSGEEPVNVQLGNILGSSGFDCVS